MSVISRLTGRIAPGHLPRRTLRLRLTLLYGGLFLASGVALLAVTYVLVGQAVPGILAKNVIPAPEGSARPSGDSKGRLLEPGADDAQGILGVPPGDQHAAVERQKSAVMEQLLIQSGIALALMLVLAIVLGWIIAGRILRPLRTITATAQSISATSLHRRLALQGSDPELKELGDTFDGLLSRLEDAFEAQRRFVANASHELRTPLARQRALGQVALADPNADTSSLRAAHERILAAGEQQERLLEALLTLARGQAGLDVREPFDLAGLTRQVIQSREPEAELRNIVFLPSVAPAVAMGHRNLAERLITNLVDNALRHNAPNGWVDVDTRSTDGRATLTVTNTGPVVPADAIDQLYQPFQRLEGTRTAHSEGLGLGLSIVLAIANAHGATVATRARPEGGLTVSVTFPAVNGRDHHTPTRPGQATAPAG
ncbi:HAMP domain-containing protein [Streptomyces sp. A7024]|uniref:histidine kinase n=1 Tax=Streptomyces coryli TaxID=1128680 RepID=A0A6G4U381_9ACTN|nr:ATP-binding protein [Streptomyces coryli]NGN66166.1 HAMP domain-containing protein [Streptomyces coryli]